MKDMNLNKAEILSPAGDMERLIAAVDFGADAVYLAGKEFGMRTSPSNFDNETLKKAVLYAHKNGVKVYLTCNTLPRNDEIKRIPDFLSASQDAGVDAFIISDIGVMNLALKYAPNTDIHISTQAGVVNYSSASTFYEMGAKRVVLARELSLEEIAFIRTHTPSKLEIEAFVHGSMCVSFSGRCLISSYLTGRDANRGDCAQPCRWKYNIVEENRAGQFFPIMEDDKGTYLFNSRDLCMIEHIPELIKAGVTSLKIEGRAKSAYYVAVTTNAYKHALNDYYKMGDNWKLASWIKEELNKISHRDYNTGFFFGNDPGQVHENGGYIRNYEVVAVCDDYENGFAEVSQRNRFYVGDTLDVLEPFGEPFDITVTNMYDEWKNKIDVAPHAMQKLLIPTSRPISKSALFRKKIINKREA